MPFILCVPEPPDNGSCPSWTQYSQCFCVIPTANHGYEQSHVTHDIQPNVQPNLVPNESEISEIQLLEDSLMRNYGHIFQVVRTLNCSISKPRFIPRVNLLETTPSILLTWIMELIAASRAIRLP